MQPQRAKQAWGPKPLHSHAEQLLLYAYSWRRASWDAVSFRHMYQAEEVPNLQGITLQAISCSSIMLKA